MILGCRLIPLPLSVKQADDSFIKAEELRESVPDWLERAGATDSKNEEESSGSDSQGEMEEGPSFTSTKKKKKRNGRRKDRGCGISPIWGKMMCKTLEQ